MATPDYDQQLADLDQQIKEARDAYSAAYKANDPAIGTAETAATKKAAAERWNGLREQWTHACHAKAGAHRPADRTTES